MKLNFPLFGTPTHTHQSHEHSTSHSHSTHIASTQHHAPHTAKGPALIFHTSTTKIHHYLATGFGATMLFWMMYSTHKELGTILGYDLPWKRQHGGHDDGHSQHSSEHH